MRYWSISKMRRNECNKILLICLWLIVTTVAAKRKKLAFGRGFGLPGYFSDEEEELENFGTSSKQDQDYEHEEKETFLRITNYMKNKNMTSGDTVLFKCKVDGWPKHNITYTWYKEDLLIDPMYDQRVSISIKSWGSKMRIKELFTLDSGLYRCEASNGLRRVKSSAYLTVAFRRPPPLSDQEKAASIHFPTPRCEKYSGVACRGFLEGLNIYVDSFENQDVTEQKLIKALNRIADTRYVSSTCQKVAFPAFCYFAFPSCDENNGSVNSHGVRLCREDCEALKSDSCHDEHARRANDSFLQEIFNIANCSLLPSAKRSKCKAVGIHSNTNDEEKCYIGNGEDYTGTINMSKSGIICETWPLQMVNEMRDPQKLRGHNFCRNPSNEKNKPWCFTNVARNLKELCNIPNCKNLLNRSNIFFVAIPGISIALLLLLLVIICCACHRKSRQNDALFTGKSSPTEIVKTPLIAYQTEIIQLKASSIHFVQDLGDGNYGKAYKALIINEPQFPSGYPVIVKSLKRDHAKLQMEQFKLEIETSSRLSHPHITDLKAVVIQPSFHCIMFDGTDQGDLLQYLSIHSPKADISNHGFTDNDGQASQHRNSLCLIEMALQVSSGMEYLSHQKFIHNDLATRNILIYENMNLKISTLDVVKDVYRSSYYRVPQEGKILPIRWMAPESLRSWQFSDKSAVWSFGVLLWEMFSYGLQPYCGYNNHEVLDIISRHQLLTCPDQCPAKAYSLMHECWSILPEHRPCFANISVKLNNWIISTKSFIMERNATESNKALTEKCFPQLTPYLNGYTPGNCLSTSKTWYSSSIQNDLKITGCYPPITSLEKECSMFDEGNGNFGPATVTSDGLKFVNPIGISCDSGLPHEDPRKFDLSFPEQQWVANNPNVSVNSCAPTQIGTSECVMHLIPYTDGTQAM